MSEEVSLATLPDGTILNDRFQLQKAFAAGGFSLVYRAIDLTTAEVIIIKECAPTGIVYRDEAMNLHLIDAKNESMLQRIIANTVEEATLLYRLTTAGVTGITRYIDSFYLNNSFYIAMSEAHGYDLHTWTETFRTKGAAFPAEFLQTTLTSVLKVLGQIHAAGYYHCDIKPANIIINEHGDVTIIDFGAARSPQKQHDDTVAISPGFSPPEFYPGHRGQIGPWTDIYMLAALVYSIITGKIPQPADERAVRDMHLKLVNMTELHKYYPEALLSSVSMALVVDAKKRFQTAEAWHMYYEQLTTGPKLVRAANVGPTAGKASLQVAHSGKKPAGQAAATRLKGSKRASGARARLSAQEAAAKKKSDLIWLCICSPIILILLYLLVIV